jgi:hypothetical protein
MTTEMSSTSIAAGVGISTAVSMSGDVIIGSAELRRAVATAAAALALAPGAHAAAPETTCDDDVAQRPGTPVLLVHGTGVDARMNWSWGYAPALRDRGHGICTVELTEMATVDIQDTIRITRRAVRETYARGGNRPIAVLGHSQGAYQAATVLRLFPALAPLVGDVVGLSGLYDRGSEALRSKCGDSSPCVPALWQARAGSLLTGAIARLPLPAGPSYTAIGTLYDSVVTPQPAANELPPGPGRRSVLIQDLCPGRRVVEGYDHIYMAGDAVAFALAVDALDHAGPADPARVDRLACAEQVFQGADPVGLALIAPDLVAVANGTGTPVAAEPPLRCPLAEGCVRARLLRHRVRSGRRVPVRVVSPAYPARVRVRSGSRVSPSVAVPRGRSVVRVRCPFPPGRRRVVVEVRTGERFVAAGGPVSLVVRG